MADFSSGPLDVTSGKDASIHDMYLDHGKMNCEGLSPDQAPAVDYVFTKESTFFAKGLDGQTDLSKSYINRSTLVVSTRNQEVHCPSGQKIPLSTVNIDLTDIRLSGVTCQDVASGKVIAKGEIGTLSYIKEQRYNNSKSTDFVLDEQSNNGRKLFNVCSPQF